MTQEEKAKRYDKAKYIMKEYLESGNAGVIAENTIKKAFPELVEPDDERIRKELIEYFRWNVQQILNNFGNKKVLAWLEKQGEQKPCMIQWKGDNLKEVIDFTGKDKNFEKWFKSFEEYEKYVDDHNGIFKLFNADGSHYEIPVGAWIVKTPDGYNVASKAKYKQKSADKVEPKFKIGDEIKTKNEESLIITRIDRWGYWSEDLFICNFDDADNWEIVEQKPAWSEEDESLFIRLLDKLHSDSCISFDSWLMALRKRVQPQTKQEWSEEDEEIYQSIMDDTVQENQLNDKQTNWLKDIKYRYFPQPQQEWSEEDEERLSDAIFFVREYQIPTRDKRLLNAAKEAEEWLKSIRPQSHWKPSEEADESFTMVYAPMG